MQPIIYDVAVSLDGYISGPDGDISKFAHEGAVVEDYTHRLSQYSSAIMGRATYEFGYQYGLAAGQNPYPHMQTYVFSQTLDCPNGCDVTILGDALLPALHKIKRCSAGPIYLCGGGAFAGSLLGLGMINQLRLKRAPIVLGGGVSLFGQGVAHPDLKRRDTKFYDNGYLLETFDLP